MQLHTYADFDRYKCQLEIHDGLVFLHLNVRKWDKTTLKMCREDLEDILSKAYDQGLDFIFFYNHGGKQLKFANLVKELDEVQTLEDGFILGAWSTDQGLTDGN